MKTGRKGGDEGDLDHIIRGGRGAHFLFFVVCGRLLARLYTKKEQQI